MHTFQEIKFQCFQILQKEKSLLIKIAKKWGMQIWWIDIELKTRIN